MALHGERAYIHLYVALTCGHTLKMSPHYYYYYCVIKLSPEAGAGRRWDVRSPKNQRSRGVDCCGCGVCMPAPHSKDPQLPCMVAWTTARRRRSLEPATGYSLMPLQHLLAALLGCIVYPISFRTL